MSLPFTSMLCEWHDDKKHVPVPVVNHICILALHGVQIWLTVEVGATTNGKDICGPQMDYKPAHWFPRVSDPALPTNCHSGRWSFACICMWPSPYWGVSWLHSHSRQRREDGVVAIIDDYLPPTQTQSPPILKQRKSKSIRLFTLWAQARSPDPTMWLNRV